jgi:hypothetical protein
MTVRDRCRPQRTHDWREALDCATVKREVPSTRFCRRREDPVRLARLAALGLVAALLSACAEHAAVSPPKSPGTSSVRVGDILIVDHFDDHSSRQLPESAPVLFVEVGYAAGEYKIRIAPEYQSGSETDYFAGPSSLFANVRAAVDGHLVGGFESRRFGVGCRATAPNGNLSGYFLAVTPALGRFSLSRLDAGDPTVLVGPQASTAVERGTKPNHLELTCAGETVTAQINSTEVASVHDSTYSIGAVMLFAGRDRALSVEARFRDLVVSEALVEP